MTISVIKTAINIGPVQSDSDDPTAVSDDENLMFLLAVTTRSGRMVRIIFQE